MLLNDEESVFWKWIGESQEGPLLIISETLSRLTITKSSAREVKGRRGSQFTMY